MIRTFAAIGVVLLAAAAAAADEVRLADGRVLEGKILSETATEVRLRLRFGGEMTVARSQVKSIEKKDLPEEEIEKRRAALDPKDAEGRWALALDAKARGVRKAWEELVEEVLRLDPDHAAANESKGRVRHAGRWMTPAEREKALKDEQAAEKEAQGLVEHEGRWVTPEERDALRKGLVLHEGRWMSEREAREAKGEVPYKDGWVRKDELEALLLRDALAEAAGVPLNAASSERFVVLTVFGKSDAEQYLKDAERTYEEFARLFGVKQGERLFDDPFNRRERRCHIVVLEKDVQYQKFLDGLLRHHGDLKKVLRPERVELMRKQKGFFLIDPDCWIVGYVFPYPKAQIRHTVVHKLSHVLVLRAKPFKGIAWPNWWLVEGLGEMQEITALGSCQVFCITTGYGESTGDVKAIGESWKAEVKKIASSGGDRRLAEIAVLGLNDLEPWDLVKSWSVVHYLVNLDPEKFAALVRRLKDRVPASDAVKEIYGATLDEIDGRWRDFVRKTY